MSNDKIKEKELPMTLTKQQVIKMGKEKNGEDQDNWYECEARKSLGKAMVSEISFMKGFDAALEILWPRLLALSKGLKEIEGVLHHECQPDNGDIFSSCDDLFIDIFEKHGVTDETV